MGRIISTSSTNTRHKHKQKRSEEKRIRTHTRQQQQQQQQHLIKAKQTQTYHEVYWIDCIYFDASCFVMASTASALSIEKLPTCLLTTHFGDAIRVDGELMHGDIRDNKCCWYGELVHESQCYQNTPIEPT